MINYDAIIFDFDGVLLESEFEGNKLLAELLTDLGHRTSTEDAIRNFVGYSGPEFMAAIERWVGGALPPGFHDRRRAQSAQALQEGVRAVVGAVDFVQSLPPDLPIAVASSSTTRWLSGHLKHLGLAERFGDHVYSGREHVDRGKPEPSKNPPTLQGLDDDTRDLLRSLAERALEGLGVKDTAEFLEGEMARQFSAIAASIGAERDDDTALREAIRAALEQHE